MNNRTKWFETALADKFPDTTLAEFSASLGLEHTVFQKFIETGEGLPSFTVNVLQGLLGVTVDEFADRGRQIAEAGRSAPAKPPALPSEPSTENLLSKARAVLDGGGDAAVTLRTVINLLKP